MRPSLIGKCRTTGFALALGCFCALLCAASAWAQQSPVTVRLEIARRGAENAPAATRGADASNVVVWLTPLDRGREASAVAAARRPVPQIVQRNKMFDPHVLVIEAGTSVEFPNKDPFFHNVFSLFDGKRFDLGLYEAGSSKAVRFERAGVSFLFCNIHSDMSAIVVAVDTPYFALSDRSGRASIPGVPDGRYQLHVWYERSSPEDLKNLERAVVVSPSTRSLETIRVVASPDFNLTHKNKYGEDYVPPPTAGYNP